MTLLCFLLLNNKQKALENRIGEDRLAEFVKIMELTLLLERWLNKDEFTEEELKVFDRFVPYFIFTFTETVKRTDGMGMKLIKIHLLHHFSTMIRLFGCVKNFDTFVPEKNHKSKVKEHARRTRFQSIDFEYRTARKDYEDCVLYAAEKEVITVDPETIITKFVGIHKQNYDDPVETMKNMRHGVKFYADFDNQDVFFTKNPKKALNWISKFFVKMDFIMFLEDLKVDLIYGSTQYNCILEQDIIKIHGDPTRNHHDWIIANHMSKQFLCHVLCFILIGQVAEPIQFPFGNVTEPGQYAVCHFVDQDVFCDEIPQAFIYREGNYTSYQTDENCDLIRGWPKFTSDINGNVIPRKKPSPTLIMIPVSKIVSTCIGIEDTLNDIPHSYIFLPPSSVWSDIFMKRMKGLMELEGESFWDHYEEEVDEENEEQLDDEDD